MPFISTMPFGRGLILVGLRNLPFNGSIYVQYGPDGEASFVLIAVSLFLCIFSAASAILAFYGVNAARIATLIFVSLDVLWWTMLAIMVLVNNDLATGDELKVAFQPVIPLAWLGVIWWNYTRPDIVEYCYQESAP